MTLRAWTYRQLDPTAWPKQGLSPANIIVTAAILLAVFDHRDIDTEA